MLLSFCRFLIISLIIAISSFFFAAIWINNLNDKPVTNLVNPLVNFFLKDYEIVIEKAILSKSSLDLSNVKYLVKKNRNIIAQVDELKIVFDLEMLTRKLHMPISLYVNGGELNGFSAKSSTEVVSWPVIFSYLNYLTEYLILDFHRINVNNFLINILVSKKKHNFVINNAAFIIEESKKKISGLVRYNLEKMNYNSNFVIDYSQKHIVNNRLSFNNIPLHLILSQLELDYLSSYKHPNNKIFITGQLVNRYNFLSGKFTNDLILSSVDGDLNSLYSNNLLRLSKLSCDLSFSNDDFKLNNLEMNFNKNSYLRLAAEYKNNNFLKISGKINNLPTYFHQFLPNLKAFGDVNDFFNQRLKNGFFTGDFVVNLKEDFFIDQQLKKDAVNIALSLREGVFDYNNPNEFFPLIEKIDGAITIDGEKFLGKFFKAQALSLALNDSEVIFNLKDLLKNDKNRIFIKAKLKGLTKDLVKFIPEQEVSKLDSKGINLAMSKGFSDVDVKIDTSIFKELQNDYTFNAKLADYELSLFDDDVIFTNGNLSVNLTNDNMSVQGPILVNGYKSDFLLKSYFGPSKSSKLKIDLYLAHIKEQRNIFAVTDGEAKITINVDLDKSDFMSYKAQGDLTNLAFSVDRIGLEKPLNVKSSLLIKGKNVSNSAINGEFILKADNGISVLADLNLTNNKSQIKFKEIKYLDTDIRAFYQDGEKNMLFSVEGEKLDLTKANLFKLLDKESGGKNSKTAINIKKIKLKNNIDLNDLKSEIHCSKKKCFKGFFDARFDNGKPIQMLIKNFIDNEKWLITSKDAGLALKAFDLNKNVKNGSLIVEVKTDRKFDSNEQLSLLNGSLHIHDFSNSNNSFFGKIVSFVSFPGLLTTVTSRDVYFNTLDSLFEYDQSQLKIFNGNAVGPYFDFTFRGKIDLKNREITLRGIVIPSLYGVNKLVKALPIISDLLSSKKRKGLISAPYRIKQKF